MQTFDMVSMVIHGCSISNSCLLLSVDLPITCLHNFSLCWLNHGKNHFHVSSKPSPNQFITDFPLLHSKQNIPGHRFLDMLVLLTNHTNSFCPASSCLLVCRKWGFYLSICPPYLHDFSVGYIRVWVTELGYFAVTVNIWQVSAQVFVLWGQLRLFER